MRRINAKLLALDVTDRYQLDKADVADIVKIEDVFLYDANQATYCCELTPSYFLVYLYTNIEFAPRFYANVETEELGLRRDELYEKYAYVPTDDCYLHCHKIENAYTLGEFPYDPDEEEYSDVFEHVREHCCGNHYV